jgi:vacuolar protein sorting-associated protein 26
MAAYFFASPIDVDIKLEGEEGRKQVEMKVEKEKNVSCPVYYDGDSVGGQVHTCRLLVISLPLSSKQ